MVNTGSATDRILNWFTAFYAERASIDVTTNWCSFFINIKQARNLQCMAPQIHSVFEIITDVLQK